MENEKLKPCPLDGHPAMFHRLAGGGVGISCSNGFCGCRTRLCFSEEEALEVWQSRAIPTDQRAAVIDAPLGYGVLGDVEHETEMVTILELEGRSPEEYFGHKKYVRLYTESDIRAALSAQAVPAPDAEALEAFNKWIDQIKAFENWPDEVPKLFSGHIETIRRALQSQAAQGEPVEGLDKALEEMTDFEWDSLGPIKNVIVHDHPECTCNASLCEFCLASNVYNDANKFMPKIVEAARRYYAMTKGQSNGR